MIEIISGAKE